MAKKRNRITAAMSKTIGETSPLIKKTKFLTNNDDTNNLHEINLVNLESNPFQPRIDINLHALNELISSIEQNGLLQPIVITEKKDNNLYTIIAGHRRYEAYKIMGREKIKATMLRNIHDKDLAIMSLTENIMRENLHPIENAIAIKNILNNNIVESQNKLAEYVGLSKGYVSKLMNILRLPTNIINIIKQDNYKDINILVLINKLENEVEMLKAYTEIKNLTRPEAEKHMKNFYINKHIVEPNNINIDINKSKVKINIDLKKLTDEQIKILNTRVESFTEEVTKLYKQWN